MSEKKDKKQENQIKGNGYIEIELVRNEESW